MKDNSEIPVTKPSMRMCEVQEFRVRLNKKTKENAMRGKGGMGPVVLALCFGLNCCFGQDKVFLAKTEDEFRRFHVEFSSAAEFHSAVVSELGRSACAISQCDYNDCAIAVVVSQEKGGAEKYQVTIIWRPGDFTMRGPELRLYRQGANGAWARVEMKADQIAMVESPVFAIRKAEYRDTVGNDGMCRRSVSHREIITFSVDSNLLINGEQLCVFTEMNKKSHNESSAKVGEIELRPAFQKVEKHPK